MSLFDGKFLDDKQIWSRIEKLEAKKAEIQNRLSQPEVSTQPAKVAELSKKLDELKDISSLAEDLRTCLQDLKTAENLFEEEKSSEAKALIQKYRERRSKISDALYQSLLTGGHLQEETEDELDIKIMKYLQALGPEYANRLAVNLGIEVTEARERLEQLLKKDLLMRVQGTMLENYHREDGWDKHMNHTYYRLSRQGKLFLRELRKNDSRGRN